MFRMNLQPLQHQIKFLFLLKDSSQGHISTTQALFLSSIAGINTTRKLSRRPCTTVETQISAFTLRSCASCVSHANGDVDSRSPATYSFSLYQGPQWNPTTYLSNDVAADSPSGEGQSIAIDTAAGAAGTVSFFYRSTKVKVLGLQLLGQVG